jgi:hypothetical protein
VFAVGFEVGSKVIVTTGDCVGDSVFVTCGANVGVCDGAFEGTFVVMVGLRVVGSAVGKFEGDAVKQFGMTTSGAGCEGGQVTMVTRDSAPIPIAMGTRMAKMHMPLPNVPRASSKASVLECAAW